MDSERILRLLAKQMGHAATDEETAELRELLLRYPDYQFFIEILQSVEGERLHKEPETGEDELVEESWSMLTSELDRQPDPEGMPQDKETSSGMITRMRKWMRGAAIWTGLVLVGGGAFFTWKHLWQRGAQEMAGGTKQVAVPFGAPRRIVLTDGSIVWLNAGSHLRYTYDHKKGKRKVYLDGEGFFDVRHDPDHPFLVYAGNIEIKVLGTAFNVQAYSNEDRIETTLIRGKVRIRITGKPDKKVILVPNEKLIVVNEAPNLPGRNAAMPRELSFQVQEVSPAGTIAPLPEVLWVQDKLSFQDESFKELAKRMERRYNVHILFQDTLLSKEILNGVFENENIQKALKLLRLTTPFRYHIQADTVYLSY